MATVKLMSVEEAESNPRVKAVFDDIRKTRNTDFINNFWRGLANQPALLEATWGRLKEVMSPDGELDPLTKELIYIAVSIANGCEYCIHSHTAAARKLGMDDEMLGEVMAVTGAFNRTNALANGYHVPVDPPILEAALGKNPVDEAAD